MVKDIKKYSPLNQITNYHVCNPGFPPCIAHDSFIKKAVVQDRSLKLQTSEHLSNGGKASFPT